MVGTGEAFKLYSIHTFDDFETSEEDAPFLMKHAYAMSAPNFTQLIDTPSILLTASFKRCRLSKDVMGGCLRADGQVADASASRTTRSAWQVASCSSTRPHTHVPRLPGGPKGAVPQPQDRSVLHTMLASASVDEALGGGPPVLRGWMVFLDGQANQLRLCGRFRQTLWGGHEEGDKARLPERFGMDILVRGMDDMGTILSESYSDGQRVPPLMLYPALSTADVAFVPPATRR